MTKAKMWYVKSYKDPKYISRIERSLDTFNESSGMKLSGSQAELKFQIIFFWSVNERVRY